MSSSISDSYFQVFQNQSDFKQWKKHKEYALLIDGLQIAEQSALIDSLDFLEHEFGTGFLKASEYHHPLSSKISNKTEWQSIELIDFVDTLKLLKCDSNSNYSKIKGKLISLKEARIEGVHFIEIAKQFISRGFQFTLLDEKESTRTADIEVIDLESSDVLTIEVSSLRENKEREDIHSNYWFLTFNCFFSIPKLPYTGRQKSKIPSEHREVIRKIIHDCKNEAIEKDQLISYNDSYLEFTVAPYSKVHELEQICQANNLRKNDIYGLLLNFDDTVKLNRKIKEKVGQIPRDKTGMIYFSIEPMFFISVELISAARRLQQGMRGYSNLLGIVLFSRNISAPEEMSHESKECIFSRRVVRNVLCRDMLFVPNYSCRPQLSENTLEKILNIFRQ
jgi:hypothetical protein